MYIYIYVCVCILHTYLYNIHTCAYIYIYIYICATAPSTDYKRERALQVALKLHPDKNQDDPEASRKFQKLAQAYQVLSDPKLRERYDQNGAARPAAAFLFFFKEDA